MLLTLYPGFPVTPSNDPAIIALPWEHHSNPLMSFAVQFAESDDTVHMYGFALEKKKIQLHFQWDPMITPLRLFIRPYSFL